MTEPDFTLDPNNANQGTARGDGMLEHSFRTYGAGRSGLSTADDVMIIGNKSYQKAKELGIPVRVVETDGTEYVVIRRKDLTYADPRARELAVADNRVGQVSLEWDAGVLAGLAEDGVDLSQFWFEDELADLLAGDEPTEGLTDPDAVPDVPEEPTTKRGDVYDPFAGSGTTLIACEDLGRACYAMDISPRYVDMAVRRWEAFTGQTATLEQHDRAAD